MSLNLDKIEADHKCTIEGCECASPWDKTILSLISELREARNENKNLSQIIKNCYPPETEAIRTLFRMRLQSAEEALKLAQRICSSASRASAYSDCDSACKQICAHFEKYGEKE